MKLYFFFRLRVLLEYKQVFERHKIYFKLHFYQYYVIYFQSILTSVM